MGDLGRLWIAWLSLRIWLLIGFWVVLLLSLVRRGLLGVGIDTDHDSVVDLAVVVEFVLSVSLSNAVIELDDPFIFDWSIIKKPFEAFLSDSGIERCQDEGSIAHILYLVTVV